MIEQLELAVDLKSHTAGLGRCHGLLRLTANALVLETWTRAIVFKSLRTPVKVLHIPLAELKEFRVRRRLLRPRISIECHSLSLLRDYSSGGSHPLKLRVKLGDLGMARTMALEALVRGSDLRLRHLDFPE